MTRAREDDTDLIGQPDWWREDKTVQVNQPDWWREDKPTLGEQAVQARIRRDKAVAMAGWLWAAVAAVVLVILAAMFVFALHAGGSLNGGG